VWSIGFCIAVAVGFSAAATKDRLDIAHLFDFIHPVAAVHWQEEQ
jgi:hypothetical protein